MILNKILLIYFSDIVRDIKMFRRISVLWMMWFTASFCGYAIDLNSSNISGDLFLNQVIFSVLIAGSKIVGIVLIKTN